MNDWDIEPQDGRGGEVRWCAARVARGTGRWHTRVEAQRQATQRNDEERGVERDPTAAKWKGWASSRRRGRCC